MTELIVAVDGGGTKTDAVALTLDGEVVARRRGPGSSPHFEGLARSVEIVDAIVRDVAGGEAIGQVDLYLSGLDLPVEIERYRAAVSGLSWAQRGLVIDNDLFALLRAGTDEADAAAVVCGSGINAVGVRADGATVRFPSLGPLSGDWGGGSGLGAEALWLAARDVDGRGERTALTPAICEALGVGSVAELIEQLHFGERDDADLFALAPVVFSAAAAGDAVARGLVDRQADEIVAFVRAIVARLGLDRVAFPVVLGGSILQAGHAMLDDRIVAGIARVAPRARIVLPAAAPILGAAIAAALHAGASADAVSRVRHELTGRVAAAGV
ncbi:N-acetylglucosamine kinase [Microbacterium sulfonylureivorans]|uniref:N-acetylglucosamine kinase n=1 Tax=Microbacterium sulfonylureivorans TaxID=2486854 RepID=UPI001F0BA0CF|nr:BadF/BadG/BcrA/BcrD ATPase family protein [Microbacterium sulfonylureivorans]